MANQYIKASQVLMLDLTGYKWFLQNLKEDCYHFSYELQEDNIWFYGEETIDIEKVAELVKKFFKETDSTDSFTIEAAYSCSKPRVGEFGGAAAFVTADSIEYISTFDWCQKKKQEHSKVSRKRTVQ